MNKPTFECVDSMRPKRDLQHSADRRLIVRRCQRDIERISNTGLCAFASMVSTVGSPAC